MISNALNVETACFQVGYESPSQFSRDYSRLFGAPPKRDATARQAALGHNRSTASRDLIVEEAA